MDYKVDGTLASVSATTDLDASTVVLTQIGSQADDTGVDANVTEAQLNAISPALTDVNASNLELYNDYIDTNENNFSSPATAAEIQDMITRVNSTPIIITSYTNISLLKNSGTSSYDVNVTDIDTSTLTVTVESNDTSILTASIVPIIMQAKESNPNLLIAQKTNLNKEFNLTTVTDATGLVQITVKISDGDLNSTKMFNVNVIAAVATTSTSTGTSTSVPVATSTNDILVTGGVDTTVRLDSNLEVTSRDTERSC